MTFDVSHLSSGWLKLLAALNSERMSVTCDTS